LFGCCRYPVRHPQVTSPVVMAELPVSVSRPCTSRLGEAPLKRVDRAGEIVWSRVVVEAGRVQIDLGLGSVVEFSPEEARRRWSQTTSQWPLVSAVFHGISRNALMARHRANHVNIAYAPDKSEAVNALAVKAAVFQALGVEVYLCGAVTFQN
jgi:hypothetical protein